MFDVIWVRGPDAVSFLQGLVSQDVAEMEVGSVARSFLLGPDGKLAALLWLLRGDDRVGIVTDAGMGGEVAAMLARYKIRVKAEITVDERATSVVLGPDAEALVDHGRWAEVDGVLRASIPLRRVARVVVAGEERPPIDSTAVRVEEGEPVMGIDVDGKTIPQETGLTGEAVSFTKGCYLGQELVARIDTRGHVNRWLCGLQVEGGSPPPSGAGLFLDDKEVGTLTSPVFSERLGSPVGLSLIRREVKAGDTVAVVWDSGSATAVVRELPM